MMEEKLKQLELEAVEKVEAASSLKDVNDIRVQYLGKKGRSQKCFAEWESFLLRNGRKWAPSPMK